jgi:hypothetical protein
MKILVQRHIFWLFMCSSFETCKSSKENIEIKQKNLYENLIFRTLINEKQAVVCLVTLLD